MDDDRLAAIEVGSRVRFVKPGAVWNGRTGRVTGHDPGSLCEWVVLLDGDDTPAPFGTSELEVPTGPRSPPMDADRQRGEA